MTIIDTSTVEVTAATPRARRPSASLLGGMGLLVRRRLWRDRVLLLSSAVIVSLATLLAYAGPQLVINTIDAGARDAVTTAGDAANIAVTFPVGNTSGDSLNSVQGTDPEGFASQADAVVGNLPSAVAALVEDAQAWVLSSGVPIETVVTAEVRAESGDDASFSEVDMRTGDQLRFGFAPDLEVTLLEGDMPEAPGPPRETEYDSFDDVDFNDFGPNVEFRSTPEGTVLALVLDPLEIALSQEVSDALELGLGDLVTVANPLGFRMTFEIVGIVAPAEPDLEQWDQFPEFSDPTVADTNPAAPVFRRGTVLVSPEAAATISEALAVPFPGSVYINIGPGDLTLDSSRDVAQAMNRLRGSTGALLPDESVAVQVDSGLARALEQYPPRARAALAQMSVVVAGVVSVAAVVIALMARLLLGRRQTDVALERARGASIPSIGVRLLLESLIFTAVGFAAGYMAATAVVGAVPLANGPAAVVAVVAILAAPLLGVMMARGTWTGKREPANRQDRVKLRKARKARRLTLEALAVTLGVLAVVTLRGRGVLQTQTTGIDPFLAAAPVLLALAVVVVVIRLYPIPMAIIQFFAKRTRGVTGVITLAKAREKMPVLPLLALTLAISVAVSGGLLVGTVRSGQDQASWERVGGQLRVDSHVEAAGLDFLEDQGLVVSQMYQRETTNFVLGPAYENAHVIAVDENYADIIAAAGIVEPTELRELAALDAAREPGDPLPVLASQEFIDMDFDQRSELFIGRVYVPVDIVGLATITPEGWATEGPYVIVPLEGLFETEFETEVEPNRVFVLGDGAEEAVASTALIPSGAVTTRAEWLSAVRDSALIGGVERMMTIAVIAVAVLAAVALLVTVLQGVRERGRALSMLRTQGMGNRYGWWLSMSELAPLTVAAVVGGAGAGLIILLLLGGTLGLEVLAGGIEPPPLVANVEFMSAVGAGVLTLLVLAVAAEVITHRRNKLSEVLRYGESR